MDQYARPVRSLGQLRGHRVFVHRLHPRVQVTLQPIKVAGIDDAGVVGIARQVRIEHRNRALRGRGEGLFLRTRQ